MYLFGSDYSTVVELTNRNKEVVGSNAAMCRVFFLLLV